MLPNYTSHLQYADPTSRLGWIISKNLSNAIIWRRPLLAVSRFDANFLHCYQDLHVKNKYFKKGKSITMKFILL